MSLPSLAAKPIAPALAALSLATLLLAGCAGTSPESSASPAAPAATASAAAASASPSPTGDEDRPDTGVVPWPDHGDFVLDTNKAIIPANNLEMEERYEDADYLMRIGGTAQARWVGGWEDNTRITGLAREVFERAFEQDRIGLVSYKGMSEYTCERLAAEPDLPDAYMERTAAVVEDLPAGTVAWVVLEPAVAYTLGECGADDPRGPMIDEAAALLESAGVDVFLDAGGSLSGTPADTAARLATLDLSVIRGFAVNVGGYEPTDQEAAYGAAVLTELAALGVDTSGLGIIVDTSRNGAATPDDAIGADACNEPSAALGLAPRLVDGQGPLLAYVWIKRPGESDGTCNGGLESGQFMMGNALQLAKNAVPEEEAS